MDAVSDNDAMDEVVKKAVGNDNPLIESQKESDDEDKKYQVFNAVCDLEYAARDLYCCGDLTFDEAMGYLADAITKLKGKEQDLMDAIDEED